MKAPATCVLAIGYGVSTASETGSKQVERKMSLDKYLSRHTALFTEQIAAPWADPDLRGLPRISAGSGHYLDAESLVFSASKW